MIVKFVKFRVVSSVSYCNNRLIACSNFLEMKNFKYLISEQDTHFTLVLVTLDV
jgi:hypothetical protein